MSREEYREKAAALAQLIEEKKGKDIVVLNVFELIPITDYFVICTAANKKQVDALCEALRKKAPELGLSYNGVEGDSESQWVLIDCIEIVIHIFREPWREYYDLEILWGDAPQVEWNSENAAKQTSQE